MEFDEHNPKRTVFNIDLDGTLTMGEYFWQQEPTPNQSVIDAVVERYRQGNIIIIHTARQWSCAPDVVAWLVKYRVPFHGLYMAKGGSDCYVDDKNKSIKDFILGV